MQPGDIADLFGGVTEGEGRPGEELTRCSPSRRCGEGCYGPFWPSAPSRRSNPRPMNSEWREKFKSEDYDVVDMVSDSESD